MNIIYLYDYVGVLKMEYTTITVSQKIKRKLESIKGDLSWDEFLEKIADEILKTKRIKTAEEFMKKFSLSEEECEFILKSLEESRSRWKK